jgi:hypothetical protein
MVREEVACSEGKASAGGAETGEDNEDPRLAGAGANGGVATPLRDGPAQVEVATADVLPCTDGVCMTEVEPRPEAMPDGDASVPGSRPPGGACHTPKF